MTAHATGISSYAAAHAVECVRAVGTRVVCCTRCDVVVWDAETGATLSKTKKTGAARIAVLGVDAFVAVAKTLFTSAMEKVADLEFAASFAELGDVLAIFGEENAVIFDGRASKSAPHGLRSGICTGALARDGAVFASFENGKVFEIADVRTALRAREIAHFRASVISLGSVADRILVGIFDGKVALLDKNGKFVFARICGEVKKVAALGTAVLVLSGESLLVFDVSLRFLRAIDAVADFDACSGALLVATAKRVDRVASEVA